MATWYTENWGDKWVVIEERNDGTQLAFASVKTEAEAKEIADRCEEAYRKIVA